MRTRLAKILLLIALIGSIATTAADLIEIPADPQKEFEFPYLLFTPEAPKDGVPQYLLVEPNNTGYADDCLEAHHAAAIQTAKGSGVGYYVATDLGIPLLIPVFPRPKSFENVYIHALDRDTILIRDGPLRRIDLQLIAMVKDAKHRLAELGRPVNDKLLMTGFSASGMFVNRFTFLHPEVVAAAAYGGVSGFIMVPLEEMRSPQTKITRRLEFPLGLADYKYITEGDSFKKDVFDRIPQFVYMGEKDDNDAVSPPNDDAYPEPERSLVFELFGEKMMPDRKRLPPDSTHPVPAVPPSRWEAVQAVYREQKLVEFKTYLGYCHKTDEKISSEVAEFFRRIIEQR